MLSIVLAGLVLSPFAGQTGIATYASMRGTVTTGWPDFKPIPNARVIAVGDVDQRETRTNAKGAYYFLTLLPGVYQVYSPDLPALAEPKPSRYGTVNHVLSANAICWHQDLSPIELSAGLAYFADIDAFAKCH